MVNKRMRFGWGRWLATFLAIAVALVAFVPSDTSDLGSYPHPFASYDSAVASVLRQRGREAARIDPLGQSLLLVHGHRTATAVLLLHGYTNSPRQFDSLGAMLFRDGANVYVPRLPRHAERNGTAAAVAHVTAEQLRDAADSAMDVADALGDTVVVAGLSLGGTMAAWIAQYRPDAHRVVVIAPLMALTHVSRALSGPVTNVAVRLPPLTHVEASDSANRDREEGWSTGIVGQTLRLGLAVRRAAKDSAPACKQIVFLLNDNDRTVASWPMTELDQTWSEHGASVATYRLQSVLGLPHDVIDPRQRVRRTDVVYPTVVSLLSGERVTQELVAGPGSR